MLQHFAQSVAIKLDVTPCIHCTDYSIRVYRSYQYSGDIKQRVTSSLLVYITLFLDFSKLIVANKLHFAQISPNMPAFCFLLF